MNPRFKIGVILLGVFLPLLVVGLLFGFISSRKKKVETEYISRKANLKAQQIQKKTDENLKVRLSRFDEYKGSWEVVLQNSDIGKVTSLLKEISQEYRGTQTFKQNNFNFVNKETGIGAMSSQPSVSFTVSLSGTFQSIQQCLLSLESRMPNLSLNSMKLEPDQNSSLLTAELSYSAWKK